MKKIVFFEIKRLFNNIPTIILSVVCPLIIIVVLTGTILPHLFSGAVLHNVSIAVYNESPDDETTMVINHLATADTIEDFISIVSVDSLDEGLLLLNQKKAAALIHLPSELQNTLMAGETGQITFYEGETNKQVVSLLYEVLENGINSINKGEQAVELVYQGMREIGYSYSDAAAAYNKTAITVFSKVLNRSLVFDEQSEISPFGNLLNIEYYSISIIILYILLCSIMIASILSRDKKSGVLERGLPCQKHTMYVLYKLMASSFYTATITGILVAIVLVILGGITVYAGNLFLIIVVTICFAIYVAAMMLALGSISKNPTNTVWISFTYCFFACFISGIFVPTYLLPKFIRIAGEFTGIPAVSRLLSIAMYGSRNGNILYNLLIITGCVLCAYIFVSKKMKGKYIGQ